MEFLPYVIRENLRDKSTRPEYDEEVDVARLGDRARYVLVRHDTYILAIAKDSGKCLRLLKACSITKQ